VYTLTGDIYTGFDKQGLIIERDNVTLEGASFTFVGDGFFQGICRAAVVSSDRNNVSIHNVKIDGHAEGIVFQNCTACSILENNIFT
jgi:hypothetical protein